MKVLVVATKAEKLIVRQADAADVQDQVNLSSRIRYNKLRVIESLVLIIIPPRAIPQLPRPARVHFSITPIPGPIIGNITSPLFGRANQPAGGAGFAGFSEAANSRRFELQLRLSF